MVIANWLRSLRRKEVESVSEECVHHWHNVGERYEEYFGRDVHDYTLSRVVEYYCPRCSGTKRIERDYAETFEKKARLRREYHDTKKKVEREYIHTKICGDIESLAKFLTKIDAEQVITISSWRYEVVWRSNNEQEWL